MNKFIPVNLVSLFNSSALVYLNPHQDRDTIRKDVAGKYGIYCWVNMTNGKIYVGRAAGTVKQLYGRIQDYYQPAYLNHPRNATSLICQALLKYGMSEFSLLILEYVDTPEESIAREQHYLTTLVTDYNTQKQAGSSLGVGVGIIQTDAQKEAAWQAQWGGAKYLVQGPAENPITTKLLEQQLKSPPKKFVNEIVIQDAIYPEIYATYWSWRTAAALFGVAHQTLLNTVTRETRRPYRGRYLIQVTSTKEDN